MPLRKSLVAAVIGDVIHHHLELAAMPAVTPEPPKAPTPAPIVALGDFYHPMGLDAAARETHLAAIASSIRQMSEMARAGVINVHPPQPYLPHCPS